jgi:hypothetical protein
VKSSFEEALIEVSRLTLVENAKTVELGPEYYPVRRTPKRVLRQVDFIFDENEIRGLEQNPETKSRWAQMARRLFIHNHVEPALHQSCDENVEQVKRCGVTPFTT